MKLLDLHPACAAPGVGEQRGSTVWVLQGAEDAAVQERARAQGTEALGTGLEAATGQT